MRGPTLRQAAKSRGISKAKAELLHELRGLSPEAIEALPDSQIRAISRRLDYPDMPRARLAWRLEQSRGDGGRIPEQPLNTALRELDSLRARQTSRSVAGVPSGGSVAPAALAIALVAGLQLRRWSSLGPVNIGGRTRSLVIHPTNTNTMWAASISGGIWRSDDAGQSWDPVDDFMANLAVTTMAMDPNDPDHIYAGTGEGFGNGDAIRGAGLFETRDGVSWSRLPTTDNALFQQVNRLALSSDGQVLLAATTAGLHRSADPNRSVWTTVLTGRVADVKFHPSDPNLAIAGSQDSGMSWYSTDGGATWKISTHSEPWSGRVELCYAAANPSVVYASTMNLNGTIWRSSNGGKSFTKRSSRNSSNQPAAYLGDQGWYDNVIWAGDPTSADHVIVGGIDLWRSTDGGNNLRDISTWWDDRSAHADHHAIVADPGFDGVNNRRVWFCNDGGVYVTDNVTTVGNNAQVPRINGWQSRKNGYAVTQFFAAAAHTGSGMIVGGTQDNGTLAYDLGQGDFTWRQIFGGDGGYCSADPNDPSTFYGEYVYLNIHRNSDGATSDDTSGNRYISGQFWNGATGQWEWKAPPFRIPDAFNQRALFIAPFVLDPNNSNRILAGGESLWRTNDAKAANTNTKGPAWARIKAPADGMISAIAITPGDSDRVWVGYSSGQIWRSANATAASPAWQRIDGIGPNPVQASRMCTQLTVSPHDPDHVLAAFAGFERNNVWLSEDNGATWRSLAASLPAAPVRAVTVHPRHPNWFYLGSEVGVFASEDRGASWSPANEGPANVSVEDLFWMGERLICVTHGRGLFAIDLTGI